MEALINNLLTHYPIVSSVLVVMGALRVVFKPIMAAVQAYVDYSDDPKEKAWLQNIMSSKYYGYFQFALDYSASIKLPPKTVIVAAVAPAPAPDPAPPAA